MRYALPLLALLALPMCALAQEPPVKPAQTIRTISEAQPEALPVANAQARLDPTAFCYYADRAYSLGAHMTDLVCAVSGRNMMVFQNGKTNKPMLEWKKATQ